MSGGLFDHIVKAFSPKKRRSAGNSFPMDALPEGKKRVYDLVILGATGFTGRLCAEYVAERYADSIPNFKWAVAGRNREKLEELLVGLGEAKNAPSIVICDCGDYSSVHAMCMDALVVLNTAGPFEKFGTPVIKACAALGTSYCDISGEVHWAKEMEEKYGKASSHSGALIIPMCGFDSIPADIGTFMVVLYMAEVLGKECGQVKVFNHDLRGKLSGGTIHTMLGVMNRPFSQMSNVLAVAGDAYAYCPPSSWRGTDSELTESHLPWFDLDMLKFTTPFFTSFTNSRVVRRSASVLKYGRRFRYREVYMAEWNPVDIAFGAFNIFAPMLLFCLAMLPPLRWFFTAFILPAPGQGPSKKEMDNGRFRLTVVGRTDGTPEEGGGVAVISTFSANGDPGYSQTARMVVESAISIVLHKTDLPGRKGGFHTSSTGIGRVLINRLRAAGMTLEVRAMAKASNAIAHENKDD